MALNTQLLEQSFELIKPRADEFASSFYEFLFKDYSQTQSLFSDADMGEQRKKLVKSLVLIVDAMNRSDELSSSLKGLGIRHVKYGVLPEHYPMVGRSLLKSFELHLGSAWTEEIEQTWKDAYETIAQLMLEGADYPIGKVSL